MPRRRRPSSAGRLLHLRRPRRTSIARLRILSGRGKDLSSRAGSTSIPAEVEGRSRALPGVAECAVVGVPHADFGEGVVAVVTAEPGAALDEKQMIVALGTELANRSCRNKSTLPTACPQTRWARSRRRGSPKNAKATSRLEADRDAHGGVGQRRGAAAGSGRRGRYCWWTRKSATGPRS